MENVIIQSGHNIKNYTYDNVKNIEQDIIHHHGITDPQEISDIIVSEILDDINFFFLSDLISKIKRRIHETT